MSEMTRASIMQNYDSEIAGLIAKKLGVSEMDGLRLFLSSETHSMLANDDLKLWYFSPLAVFDMWECEQSTGEPRNSLYLRGDEHE